MDLSGVGPVLTLLGTFGGVWVVVLLFRWVQRDFVARYRTELTAERTARERAEAEADSERRKRQEAEQRAAHFEYLLNLHGIDH